MGNINILSLRPNSVVFMMEPNAVKLYMHLLAGAVVEGTMILSKITLEKIPFNYKKYLDRLTEANVIDVAKDTTIYLGEAGQLFANDINVLASLLEQLQDVFKTYAAKRRKNTDVLESWARAHRMITNLDNIKRGYDLMILYTGVYSLVNRNPPSRDFTGKEVGQFSHLYRMYGAEKAVQLICYYLLNYTEETTNPTVSQLIGQKDLLFSDMRKGDKKTTRAETIMEDSDDF